MTTKDWIEKKINTTPDRELHCSSVYQFTNGNFYSYGSHYPLLVNYRGKWICNNAGYSATTGKHIGYCYDLADYFIPFAISGDGYYSTRYWSNNEEEQRRYLEHSLIKAISDIQKEMQTKKRHNTRIYENLQSRRDQLAQTLEEIKAL